MDRRIVSVLLFALTATALSASSLWDEAVEYYRTSVGLVPGHMSVSFDQFNGKGELVSSDESEIEVWLDENGEVQSRVLSSKKNGEPVDPSKANADTGSGASAWGGGPQSGDDENPGGGLAGLQRSPFDPDEQANVTIVDVGAPVQIDGVTARPYRFEHRTGNRSRNTGTAWLNAATGAPLRLELTVDPLPPFVSELAMRQEYGRDPDGNFVVTAVEFDGAGRALFFTRRLESRMVFSHYFRSE